MIPITIKEIQDEKELSLLKEFMLRQPQFYPDFQDWIDDKCVPRIETGQYKNIIAISEGLILGDTVYRYLDNGDIEIKNFRIDPKYRNRDLGHFLLTQIERDNPNTSLTLDVTVDNFSGVEFFVRNRFQIVSKESLYLPSQYEFIMEKTPL